MSMGAVFALTLVSLIGLGYLAWSDPKRRRTFRETKLERRPLLWPARAALFGPGALLVAIGHWSGLTIWAGAVTVLGWIMAAISPAAYARFGSELRGAMGDASSYLRERVTTKPISPSHVVTRHVLPRLKVIKDWTDKSIMTNASSEEITELKARIATLEAHLHRLENRLAPRDAKAPDLSEETATTSATAPRSQIN